MSNLKLKLRAGEHRDQIDIITTEVSEPGKDTVAKKSAVTVFAKDDIAAQPLWVGLKLHAGQKVSNLTVGPATWVTTDTPENRTARETFRRFFPPKAGEKWVAYLIARGLKRRLTRRATRAGLSFDSALTLRGRVAVDDGDAQVIPIAVCYAPENPDLLKRSGILLGHSLVQAPPRPDARAGAKGRRAVRRRVTRRRRT